MQHHDLYLEGLRLRHQRAGDALGLRAIIGAWASVMVGAIMILASDSLGFVLVTMYLAD